MKHKGMGVTLKTALLSWLVTIATVLFFVTVIIPEQQQTFIENLNSKAHGVAVSLWDVVAGAVVNEDFGSVVDHCIRMLAGDPTIDYLVITRNDGFSLLHDHQGWRVETDLPGEWRPERRVATSGIAVVSLFNRRAFHYSTPFDYSGLQWGWIHVGLSLESYDRSVAIVYSRTGLLAVLCILLSLVASFIYARQLVKPILSLQKVVQRVAAGDLSVRAVVESGDEVGSLATSFNSMTEALRQRDCILQSVRLAAQRFLSSTEWSAVIQEVLAKIGQAAGVSHLRVFERHVDERGVLMGLLRQEWVAPGCNATMNNPKWRKFSVYDSGLGASIEKLQRGEVCSAHVRDLEEPAKGMYEAHTIKSIAGVPIMVEGSLWGVLSLEDGRRERQWTDAERDSLQAAADMLSAAIARQRMQDALLRAKEAADAGNRAKSEFLANMSHELRTPLHQIIGFTELVVDDPDSRLNEEGRQFLTLSLQSSQHLLSIINDILDITKVESGRLDIRLSEIHLVPLLERSLEMIRDEGSRKSLDLSLRADGVPETIVADERMLTQILLNLLDNAAKFTGEGGSVQLRANRISWVDGRLVTSGGKRLDLGQTVTQQMFRDVGFIEVTVADSGVGISEEDLERIFNPFEQADSSISRRFEGTGLGLALTKGFVEMHGGRIWAESQGLGKGSRLCFVIPVSRPQGPRGHGGLGKA